MKLLQPQVGADDCVEEAQRRCAGDCGGGRTQTLDRTNHGVANWQSSGSGHCTIPIRFGGLRMCGPRVAGHDRHRP